MLYALSGYQCDVVQTCSSMIQIFEITCAPDKYTAPHGGIESTEFKNRFSRLWKSIEFGQNGHKVL